MINKVWICTTRCSINCETNVGFKFKKKLIKIISEDLAKSTRCRDKFLQKAELFPSICSMH